MKKIILQIGKHIFRKFLNFIKENIFSFEKIFFHFSKEIFIFLYKIQNTFFENRKIREKMFFHFSKLFFSSKFFELDFFRIS